MKQFNSNKIKKIKVRRVCKGVIQCQRTKKNQSQNNFLKRLREVVQRIIKGTERGGVEEVGQMQKEGLLQVPSEKKKKKT